VPVEPGQTLLHYRIVDKLGEGGMGAVYRAEDTRLGREIAIKVMPAELAADAERRRRFEQEARAVAALKHPNIVTVYSVEEADGVSFITMELIEGRPLSELIPKGGLDLMRLACALLSASAAGIASSNKRARSSPPFGISSDSGRPSISSIVMKLTPSCSSTE
jgi:serine/threonine protein kinase